MDLNKHVRYVLQDWSHIVQESQGVKDPWHRLNEAKAYHSCLVSMQVCGIIRSFSTKDAIMHDGTVIEVT